MRTTQIYKHMNLQDSFFQKWTSHEHIQNDVNSYVVSHSANSVESGSLALYVVDYYTHLKP